MTRSAFVRAAEGLLSVLRAPRFWARSLREAIGTAVLAYADRGLAPGDPPPPAHGDGLCYRWLAWATQGATQLPLEEMVRRCERGEEPPTEPLAPAGPRPIDCAGNACAGGAR